MKLTHKTLKGLRPGDVIGITGSGARHVCVIRSISIDGMELKKKDSAVLKISNSLIFNGEIDFEFIKDAPRVICKDGEWDFV